MMNWWLVVFGLGIHLIFFYSIFDIYFTSPLVHGMTPETTPLSAPATRLVLFVADGLRADKLFELDENGQTRAPFLRSVVQEQGAWGVSHTRVPTESRPGHVALIAGFYEDVSAIAKGWKENPVEFDSVFNESRYTWSWGSPDILPMFSKGASGDHVYTEMYPGESEDFAGADLGKLDTWVFDKVKEMITEAGQNKSLSEKLNQNKIVLFMHLLGLDTNGHAHRPYSHEYLRNIALVDSGIQEMVQLLDDYYHNDGATAYVFSADHGMTNWGSHGAGDPSETLTPLIAWGAGVRGPLSPTLQYTHDGFEKDWQIRTKRSDVNQADIAPLMSSLIGLSYPLNSVGTLPLDYLDGTLQYKAESIFTNARQILNQFQLKMEQKRRTTLTKLFTPFKPLTPSIQADMCRQIRGMIQDGEYQQAILSVEALIELALQGLSYYHNYDRFFLGMSICLGYVGWMMYIMTLLIQNHTPIVHRHSRLDTLQCSFWTRQGTIAAIFIIIGVVTTLLLYVQSLPLTHYLYCLVPVILWHKVAQKYLVFKDLYHYIVDHSYVRTCLLMLVLGISGLEVIVLSFSHRELLSIGLISMAIWALVSPPPKVNKGMQIGWVVSMLCLSVFPMLPVVGRLPNYHLVYLAGILALCLAIYISSKTVRGLFSGVGSWHNQTNILTAIQLVIIVLSVFIVWSTQYSISQKQGLPLVNQLLSWLILVLSLCLPLFSQTRMYERLSSIALAFIPPYLLLSTAHEGIFCVLLCVVLFFWLQMESAVYDKSISRLQNLDFSMVSRLGETQRKLVVTDARCAYFFIFFLIAAFFGTGNIASINSFDPSSVLCFLTVFSPFVMGALMMWKNLIPFMLVTCTFNAVHLSVNVPTQSLFLVVLLMSDFMALNFFFLVKDYGSWLDIGTSISHYVIVMATIIFLNLLLALTKVFTNVRLQLGGSRIDKQQ